MELLPYSLACIASALMFFYFAWTHRDMHLQQTWMKGIASLFLLIGAALATPWLWRLPFQVDQGGDVIAPIIFAGVPIALLGSLFGVVNAGKAIYQHSTTK